MKKLTAAVVTGLMALTIAAPAGAVEPTRTVSVDDTTAKTAEFTSEPASGTGTSFFLDGTATTYECTGEIDAYCERTLIEVTGFTEDEIAAAVAAGVPQSDSVSVTMDIGGYAPVPVTDFDLVVYASDAAGTVGPKLGQSGNNPGDPETFTASVSTTTAAPTKYLLMEVVYFAVVQSTYDATITAR